MTRATIFGRATVFLLGFLLAGSSLFAQNTSLSGRIKDPQGAVVPGSTVTITNQAGAQRSAVSDDEGVI